MQVVAAHRQKVISAPHVNVRCFVVMPLDMADRAQSHDDRSMDLRELRRIKLPENLQAAVLSLERGKTFDATGANRVENGTMTRTKFQVF